jgi:AraC-like DNA-binding protein
MNPKRAFEPHLVLKELTLAPGSELLLKSPGWHFLSITCGVAYWLHPRSNCELMTGSVLLFSDRAKGVIRASQLGIVTIQQFRVQVERLTGLTSFSDQSFLQKAASEEQQPLRLFAPSNLISRKFRTICEQGGRSSLSLRLRMLELFVDSFGNDFQKHRALPDPVVDATTRLIRLLDETSPADFLELRFGDLVRETRCTPRHLSRIFQKIVGMSFREKKSQVRLLRAQELLSTTESKVVEVALASGYQSPSLFNVMFKRRFGLTPGEWRGRSKGNKSEHRVSGGSATFKHKVDCPDFVRTHAHSLAPGA